MWYNTLIKTNRSFQSKAENGAMLFATFRSMRIKIKSIDRLKESFGAEELIFFFIPSLVKYSKCAA